MTITILLELEVGVETAVVISALEAQAQLFSETAPTQSAKSPLKMYAAVSERLATQVLVLTEQATNAKVVA